MEIMNKGFYGKEAFVLEEYFKRIKTVDDLQLGIGMGKDMNKGVCVCFFFFLVFGGKREG